MDPESPFNHIPPYISAALRGEEPPPLYADEGGDSCYAPDAGRAIALLTTAATLRHDTYNVSDPDVRGGVLPELLRERRSALSRR